MKKNAFTLIELLAVIVILSIIALIATPIILGIINDSKEQTNKISAENYIDAVEQAIVRENMKGVFRPEECTIADKVVTCTGYDKPLEVEVDGEVPTGRIIKINNGSVAIGTELIFKEFKATINEEGKLVVDKLDIQEESNIQQEGPEHLAKNNVRAVTESKTGIVPTQDSNGNITPGSEFKIRVSDKILDEKGDIAEYTFFVLSNDGNYVNLIAEQNITIDGIFTSEPQDADEWYVTSSNSYDNRYGPQTAYAYLSKATNNWTNVPIIKSFDYIDEGNQSIPTYGYQNIVTKLDEASGDYITTITPYSSDYGDLVIYKNMRARLPYVSEVIKNSTCNFNSSSCPLWLTNYLSSSNYYSPESGKVNSIEKNTGYWMLSSVEGQRGYVANVDNDGKAFIIYTNESTRGIRPVITVLKSDLLRVMK